MTWRTLQALHDLPAADWDALAGPQPLVGHAFLSALEDSGSVRAASGWQPLHQCLEDDHGLAAALPLYLKGHSYGEYVFDWEWARASQHLGREYYPKLLTAVPFTPATGPRLLARPGQDAEVLAERLFAHLRALAGQLGASSWHLLFPREEEAALWAGAGLLQRLGCQYHWFDHGYGDFDGFLGHFRASRRKAVRKERREVAEQGIRLETRTGAALEPHHWAVFYRCYRHTYARLSGHGGYLNQAFFQQLGERLADRAVMVLALHRGEYVAAALCLRDEDTLYGRYWGALDDFSGLHFEACYYQGIDYCLRHGLRRFDPGAQGEHKIPRGFEPVITHSLHWLAEPRLRAAVADFLRREAEAVRAYAGDARALLPFHRAGTPG